jgi:hypothetical protein
MLLKRRPPALESQPITTVSGYGHVDRKAVGMLRWLAANHINYVLVGPIAEAIRSGGGGLGPVAIVPAPFGRNYERLARGLWSAHARLRVEGEPGTVPVKLTEEKLERGQRWTLRCGVHDLDIEARPEGPSRYQELLYEAGRFELAPDLSVDVASPEDLEHYAHVRRTGSAPEIRIIRTADEQKPAPNDASGPAAATS